MRKIGCLFLSILLICSCFSISVYSFYSENVLVYGVETVYSECYATEKTELEKFTDTSYVSLYQYNFDNKGYIIGINEVEELEQAIKKVEIFEPKKYQQNNEKMLRVIEDFIDKV